MQKDLSKLSGGDVFRIARKHVRSVVIIASVAFGTTLTACAKEGAAKTDANSSASAKASENGDLPAVVATIGDEKITREDLLDRIGANLDAIENQYRRNKDKAIEDGIQKILKEKVIDAEAAKQGKTTDQLVEAEAGGAVEPTDAEVSDWYTRNKLRVGERTLEQVRPQIVQLLKAQKLKAAKDKLEQRLNDESKVTVLYQPYRLAFNNEGAPTLGKQGAPVTVVEFSDFQCPFCYQFAPTLKKVEQDFGSQVQVVYRQFPLVTIHPFAFKAAEASLCAQDQGKFWEMHDAMFSDQQKLAVADLKSTARRLGMDEKKFNACMDTGKFTEKVQNDMIEGSKLGITGTPAVFINGVFLEGGAVPYETVSAAIKTELDRAGGK
jgi:protein-disulfide isomerase